MNSDLASLVLRAWVASPYSTIRGLDHQFLDFPRDAITSHLIFVLRHPAAPQPIRLQAARALDDIQVLVIIPRHLTATTSDPQVAVRNRSTPSTSSRNRLYSVSLEHQHGPTSLGLGELFTGSCRRSATTYLLDGRLSSRCSAAFSGPRFRTPLRISFRSESSTSR